MDTLTRQQHRTRNDRAAGRAIGGNATTRRRRAAVTATALAMAVPLTFGAAGDAGAAGDHAIVFARYTAAAPIEDLYAISSSGGTPVKLTHTSTVSDVMPSWSPDGKRVAFVRYGSGGAIDGIWTMKTTGGDLKAVPGTKGASDPAWSPDGKRIAYAKPVGTQREIYVADIDGTPATRLTHTAADDLHPTWSPDGKYLAFNRADASGHSRVMRIRLSTLAQTAVTGAAPTTGHPTGHTPTGSSSAAWTPRASPISTSSAPTAPDCTASPRHASTTRTPRGPRTAAAWSSPEAVPTTRTPNTSTWYGPTAPDWHSSPRPTPMTWRRTGARRARKGCGG